MAQSWSVFAQHGSIGGDSASRSEHPSFLSTNRTSDLKREGRVTQKWLDDQAPPGATIHLDESAAIRHVARVSTAIEMVDHEFDNLGEFETRKLGKATNHYSRTIETSLAQQKKIVALSIPNGLGTKDDSSVGGSTSDPSTALSESNDTWRNTQDGQSATDPSRDFRIVSTSTLNEMQEGLIKKIMTKFRARFDDLLRKTIGHSGKSTSSRATSNRYEGHGKSSTWTASSGRSRNGDSSFKGGNGAKKPYDRSSKTPRKGGDHRKDRDSTLDFACPFKKRHPRIYNLDDYKTCTVGHWPSIALMKQHLSRRHKPLIQCQICWICFQTQAALHSHLRLSTPCQVLEHTPVPGMTVEIESWLKTEKRPGQSEVDRWNAIYEKLFPGAPIPSPYFDPLIDFHNFEQAEVPRIFEESIRTLIAEEMLPLEERIIERMGELVRSSQERALSAYRAIYTMDIETEPQEDPTIPPPQLLSYPYRDDSEPREQSNDGHFLGSNDLLMCGCHDICTCLRDFQEPTILPQPTFTQGPIPAATSGYSIDVDNTTIVAMQEPEFTNPKPDGEGETFEWSSWMND